MRILFYGLNFAPEEIGIGKYSGEMIQHLAEQGHEVTVVTSPPYYPRWKVSKPYSSKRYCREFHESDSSCKSDARTAAEPRKQRRTPQCIEVIRCPLWVPQRVTGLKRIVHLATFGLSSLPVMLWKAVTLRPDLIMTVEPAAFCMPATRIAGRLCKAKTWLHVQDFEVDAAFDLGILTSPKSQKLVLKIESLLMRRFDVVSTISSNMVTKLIAKGIRKSQLRSLPNWVDCDKMFPIVPAAEDTDDVLKRSLRDRHGIPRDAFVAMYAGNVGAKQGLNIIADTAKTLREHRRAGGKSDDIHFVICGQGAAYPALEGAVRGLENVQLLPVQPAESFNSLMNCADIHLLPQKAGAADLVMPSKLTGMMATGRPVVACAAAGTQIAKVVQGHGLVVPPGDVEGFASAITALADDAPRCAMYGENARRYAVKHLSRDSLLAKFTRDVHELCSSPAEAGEAVSPNAESEIVTTLREDSAVVAACESVTASPPVMHEKVVRVGS